MDNSIETSNKKFSYCISASTALSIKFWHSKAEELLKKTKDAISRTLFMNAKIFKYQNDFGFFTFCIGNWGISQSICFRRNLFEHHSHRINLLSSTKRIINDLESSALLKFSVITCKVLNTCYAKTMNLKLFTASLLPDFLYNLFDSCNKLMCLFYMLIVCLKVSGGFLLYLSVSYTTYTVYHR